MWIPFNRITRVPEELQHITEAHASGELAGDNGYSKKCQAWLRKTCAVAGAFLTPSCTAALEMSALLAGVQAGDEVIVPSFTFVSTANAFAIFGARLVFADSVPDTLNMDAAHVESLITERTKAIVLVHYAGIADGNLDRLLRLCAERGIHLIEDAAHSLGGSWQGRPLGSLGMAGTLSFHESKNFSCGEGGALLVRDEETARRAEILREKGTNRSRLIRGEVKKYEWVDFGSSYLPSDLQAAMLWAQLQRADELQLRRRAIWDRYQTELADWAAARGAQLPHIPAGCSHANHLYWVILPDNAQREHTISHLQSHGVQSYFHYLPLHLSPVGKEKFGGREGQCPVAESASARLLRLPLYSRLTDEEQSYVIRTLRQMKD